MCCDMELTWLLPFFSTDASTLLQLADLVKGNTYFRRENAALESYLRRHVSVSLALLPDVKARAVAPSFGRLSELCQAFADDASSVVLHVYDAIAARRFGRAVG